MRASTLLLVTLRDDPAEAEITSHKLLVRAGFIRRIAAGIYAYLPLMWRVLRKVQAIVREEMEAVDAIETLLPQLQPADLWQQSGRWSAYTAGEGIMFHLSDRQGRQLGLGPTHEEVITCLAAELIRSYRQLPVCLYQMQTKFRDEIRPRFGMMRGREFIMKDAYSFHGDEADLKAYYARMDGAYRRIFRRCGLRTLAVQADSGAIGGSASQEFMVVADAGEDLVLISGDGSYAANQERAVSLPSQAVPLEDTKPRNVSTPGQMTIEAVCGGHGLDPTQMVKVLLHRARFGDGPDQLVLTALRGDQELNDTKLGNAVTAGAGRGTLLDLALLDGGDLALPFGFLGPDLGDPAIAAATGLEGPILRFRDHTAAALHTFVCGANTVDTHRVCDWDTLALTWRDGDFRNAQPGDRCRHDPTTVLEAVRGIEVGHIFQLGCKYSEALAARFSTAEGGEEALWMGCYGIGISRLAQAAIEQHHDGDGMVWPTAIAPFEVVVSVANVQRPEQLALGERLYDQLRLAGVDVLLDDRPERAGVKFKDADLLGIPWRVVVGRGAAREQVELKPRTRPCLDCTAADLLTTLLPRLERERQEMSLS